MDRSIKRLLVSTLVYGTTSEHTVVFTFLGMAFYEGVSLKTPLATCPIPSIRAWFWTVPIPGTPRLFLDRLNSTRLRSSRMRCKRVRGVQLGVTASRKANIRGIARGKRPSAGDPDLPKVSMAVGEIWCPRLGI